MNNSDNLQTKHIEMLTGENYHIWAIRMKAILRAKRLFEIISSTNIPIQSNDMATPAGKEWRKWEDDNNEAFSMIILTLSPLLAGMFAEETKAKNIWDELAKMYTGNKEDRKIDAMLEFKDLKMTYTETVDNYIARAKNIISKINELGGTISMREIVFYTVRGIHSKLENIAIVLRTRRDLTLNEVHQHLKEEENRNGEIKNNYNSDEKALKSQYKRKPFNANPEKLKKECFICHKLGHIAKNCWFKNNPNEKRNFQPSRGKGKYTERQNNFNARLAKNNNELALNGYISNKNKMDSNNKNKNEKYCEWSIDSGCSIHMTCDRENLFNIIKYDGEINIAEENRTIQAVEKGEMRMILTTNEKEILVRLKNVLYVPKLRDNLLSVKELIKQGNEIKFNKYGAIISNKQTGIIAKVKEKNSLYILKGKVNNPQHAYIGKSKKEVDYKLWHDRLAHLNNSYMERMIKNDIVRGFKYRKITSDPLRCQECTQGKLNQKPFKKVNNSQKANKPLELLHIDLCGPMPKNSLGGNKYMFVIVDTWSRMTFIELLKTKEEAYDKFVKLKNKIENEQNQKIKNIRSDNGGEFINKKFEDLFSREGIHHQRTVAYSPSSNGLAERVNRTLLDNARTMLIDAHLPINFWGEAVNTAAYIKNRTYHKSIGNTTPIEKWTKNKPTIEYIRKFGCLAYSYIHRETRNKLQPKSEPGIMVGYSTNRKAYRIYIPNKGKIKEERSIEFYEDKLGSDLLNEKTEQANPLQIIYQPYNNKNMDEDTPNTNIVETMNMTEIEQQEEEELNNEQQIPEMETRTEATQQHTTKTKGRPHGTLKGTVQKREIERTIQKEIDLQQKNVRRSQRLKEKANKTEMNEITNESIIIPNTYKEAIKTKEKEEWEEAMRQEMQSLKEHKVWDTVKRTPEMKILKNRWIYTVKRDTNGKITRYKARLVVKGNTQKKGIDFEESYAPVIKTESLRLMIALAARNNLKMRRFDVKTAYLYGTLEETYMEMPEGGDENKEIVCHLKKSLYGLPQSGRNWNIKLNGTLNKLGFFRIDSDPSMYIKRRGAEYIIIGTYVDDCMVMGTNEQWIEQTMDALKKEFQMREETGNGNFLGLEINETNDGYSIDQMNQIRKMLKNWDMQDCNPTKTPVDCNIKLEEYQDSPETDQHKYQELVGSLSYISNGSRPDITYIANKLAQFVKDPRTIHMAAGKRVLRYLKGSINIKLRYKRGDGVLKACSDASWSSTHDCKSQSGYCISIGDNLITWKTKKQELVALSTCESEINAICETIKEIEWMNNVTEELGMTELISKPTKILTDSRSAIEWSNGQTVKQRTKHFNRKYYKIREEIEKGNITLEHKPGSELEADIFTKGVTEDKLQKTLKMLGLE